MKHFNLPDLGEGLPDAEIRQWHVKVGDTVKKDQIITSLETAKAVVDVPSPYSGRIEKLFGKPGDIINTGEPLVGFEEKATEPSARKTTKKADKGTVVGEIETGEILIEESATGIEPKRSVRQSIKAVPAVRALAQSLNVDLAHTAPTGPNNSITMKDVQLAAEQLGGLPPKETTSKGEPLRGIRRSMAQTMAVAHRPITIIDDVDIENWSKLEDVTLRLIRGIIKACKQVPDLNGHFYSDQNRLHLFTEIHLGIAMDTKHGLYVPVLKDVAKLPESQRRKIIDGLHTKAMNQQFIPAELQGSTITLSNFGTIAGRYATMVVAHPTLAIIGAGKARDQVVAIDRKPVVHKMLPVSLSFDHRVVTGGEAARFLAVLNNDLHHKS